MFGGDRAVASSMYGSDSAAALIAALGVVQDAAVTVVLVWFCKVTKGAVQRRHQGRPTEDKGEKGALEEEVFLEVVDDSEEVLTSRTVELFHPRTTHLVV